jgi:hypothetical protein
MKRVQNTLQNIEEIAPNKCCITQFSIFRSSLFLYNQTQETNSFEGTTLLNGEYVRPKVLLLFWFVSSRFLFGTFF